MKKYEFDDVKTLRRIKVCFNETRIIILSAIFLVSDDDDDDDDDNNDDNDDDNNDNNDNNNDYSEVVCGPHPSWQNTWKAAP